jgi:hypothetical protein
MNIFLQILIGFILADLITGIFHWFEDTYLDYCIHLPIIGTIAKDNELHHYFPRSIIAYSYLDHISLSLPLTIIILIIVYIINKSIFKLYFFLASFAFFSITSNIFHRFSHMRDCENNIVVIQLQKIGILCSHSHHSLHHTSVNDKYCVISEYNNYILDTVYFWRILEYIIYLFTGIKPNRKSNYDSYSSIHNYMHINAKLECPDKPTMQDVNELIENLKLYKNCNKEH